MFWYVPFNKKIIVLHHSDYIFLFWHLCQIHTFSNSLNDKEMITSHFFMIKMLRLWSYNFQKQPHVLWKQRRYSMKKAVLRNFAKFTGKHLCRSLFFNNVTGLRPATLLKKRLWHSYFPVNFAKFLGTPFFRTPLGDCFWTFLW